jgi:hypothetical protein
VVSETLVAASVGWVGSRSGSGSGQIPDDTGATTLNPRGWRIGFEKDKTFS